MRYATTGTGDTVTRNYPFGHAVNRMAGNVCWKLAISRGQDTQADMMPNRAWIEIEMSHEPDAIAPGNAGMSVSTGARNRNHDWTGFQDRARRITPRHALKCAAIRQRVSRIASTNTNHSNRTIAQTEKARCANTGPSRNSMIVVVGTRSDRRQTA
jgi:hypothetical protein